MRAVTDVPIKFLGTGEKLDGFEPFHPDRLADRILGMGDVMTLIERAESTYNEEEAIRLQRKLMDNQFTLQDFLEQLQKIRRMGSFSQILGMIPGMSRLQMEGALDQEEMEGRISQVEAIINSMTMKERSNPRILNASRKRRIAAGSGVEVRDINDLLKQFRQMQKMMKQLKKGRMPSLPGLPRLG
jgi:signal recognition particle subunit SRP54